MRALFGNTKPKEEPKLKIPLDLLIWVGLTGIIVVCLFFYLFILPSFQGQTMEQIKPPPTPTPDGTLHTIWESLPGGNLLAFLIMGVVLLWTINQVKRMLVQG